jgi:plastocyanin
MYVNQLGRLLSQRGIPCVAALVLAVSALSPGSALATTTNVNVGDNFFSPTTITIQSGDTVQWTWTGTRTHTSTSNSGLWDSGFAGKGNVFTFTFDTAGSYPYHCQVHAGQNGTVTVKVASNAPPTVSIVSPQPGAVFAAPWTGTIQAQASDPGGSVAKLEFYLNDTLLDTVMNPASTASAAVTDLSSGAYSLKAVATDDLGLTNVAVLSVSVADPLPITLSNLTRPSATSFQFDYSGTPGLSYVISRTSDFVQWTPLATNVAAGATSSFVDITADGPIDFYKVSLQPNP